MAFTIPEDEPPSYTDLDSASRRSSFVPSPSYSRTPSRTEYVIRSESDASCSSPDRYTYSSKSLSIDLGPKLWGTSIPVYGNNAAIEGSLAYKGDLKHVVSIEVKLEGSVTNTYYERGMISGCSSVAIASSALTVPVTSPNTPYPISLLFPAYALGRRSYLPPSAITYYPGSTCDIKYRLKITVHRKGLRRNESLKIPVLYLPRTFSTAPLPDVLPSIASFSYTDTLAPDPPGIKVIEFRPRKGGMAESLPKVALSLPASLSFSSYETIPMKVNISSPSNPAVVKLLQMHIRIQLVKRTRAWMNDSRRTTSSEALVGVARVARVDESQGDMTVCELELRAERSAVQKSWTVEGVADQQYFIHASIRPPSGTSSHIPDYEAHTPIEITTDSYDSPEREIAMMGGTPSPAIGTLAVREVNLGHIARFDSRQSRSFSQHSST